MIEKNINKIKSWFFERNNQTDKYLTRLTKKKEKSQITRIRNERVVQQFLQNKFGVYMSTQEKWEKWVLKYLNKYLYMNIPISTIHNRQKVETT